MRKQDDRYQTLLLVAFCLGLMVVGFFVYRWQEQWRASIWAEELRKSGVTAPVGVPR